MRARDLFYGLWVNDLFMRRVEANAEWSLFCPNEAPGLAECWGEAFDALYQKFEREGRAKRVIKAQQLWFAILEAQVSELCFLMHFCLRYPPFARNTCTSPQAFLNLELHYEMGIP